MKIALDFDGVLGHTMDLWVDEFNRIHPSKKATVQDIKNWSFYKTEPFSIEEKEVYEIFDYCWKHWEQIKNIEVDQWIKVDKLKELGKVHIVTSVVKNKDPIRKWLSRSGIITDDIVFSQEKWKLNYDYFIDDAPHNAENIKKEDKICLLYDQSWNRDVKTNGNIKRTYSLIHAYDIIKSRQNGNK